MGYLHYEQHELLELCKQAEARGFQLAIHAACNAGIDMALKAYEGIPSGRYRRRVEHLVSLDRAQALRLAQQGAVGVVQPSYVQFFGDEWEALPSPRRLHSVALRDLLDAGVTLAGSSDAPVAPYQPLLGMQAAVTRRTHGGLVHQNEQAITPLEALGLWTTGSAVAANQEGKMGVIRPGANADLVVLSGNPLETPPEKIGSIAVDRTMIAGKSVFSRKLEADRRATHSS